MKHLIYTLIFVLLAGAFNAGMDTLQFHYESSVFSNLDLDPDFWNPEFSWLNKYDRLEDGRLAPKFWGSTTFFVFVTDGWHLFQFMFLNFFCLACVPERKKLFDKILIFTAIRVTFGSSFTLFFDKIL